MHFLHRLDPCMPIFAILHRYIYSLFFFFCLSPFLSSCVQETREQLCKSAKRETEIEYILSSRAIQRLFCACLSLLVLKTYAFWSQRFRLSACACVQGCSRALICVCVCICTNVHIWTEKCIKSKHHHQQRNGHVKTYHNVDQEIDVHEYICIYIYIFEGQTDCAKE